MSTGPRVPSPPFLAALAAAALLPGGLGGQVTVEGEVLDDLTGAPVQGVIVQLPDLGRATLTDEFGYFRFDAVTGETQGVSTFHLAYHELVGEAPVHQGDILVLRLTPRPIAVAGVDVSVADATSEEIRRSGRGSDYIDGEAVREAAGRTNKLLEVMRSKAPPRLNIQQGGSGGGIRLCIQTTRMRPSVQELRDIGNACVPALLVLDGVVVYAPPKDGVFASLEAPDLPQDVAYMLLNQDPNEIESIRVLTGSEAFFRYGQDGRLGAVEIVTRRPERMK